VISISAEAARRQLRRASAETNKRRLALLTALERLGVRAHDRLRPAVWILVREGVFAVRELLDAGFVLAGERFRLRTPPAVRVTTAQLLPAEVEPLADALVEAAASRSLISQ
jgi:hypothetical protein